MTPESFDLDGDAPTATVQAASTKNRREAVQPLPLDVAAALRHFPANKPAGAPVWPDNPKAMEGKIPLAHSLAHNRRKRWISVDNRGRRRPARKAKKIAEKPRNPCDSSIFPRKEHVAEYLQGDLNPLCASPNAQPCKDVTETPEKTLPYSLPCKTQIDADLALIIDAWSTLPQPLKAGILAMIGAHRG